MPTRWQVVHSHEHDKRHGAFSAKSVYLRPAALIEGSSGSRRQACVSVLITLMRWGSAPLNLPPQEHRAFNDDALTFSQGERPKARFRVSGWLCRVGGWR